MTIGFVVIALLANGRKRKTQSRNTEAEPEEAPEWIPIPGMPFPTRPRPVVAEPTSPAMPKQSAASRPKPQKRGGTSIKIHPDSQETLNSPSLAAERSKRIESPALRTPEPIAEQHPDMTDFDLRKVVIWSEILRPKFDED